MGMIPNLLKTQSSKSNFNNIFKQWRANDQGMGVGLK